MESTDLKNELPDDAQLEAWYRAHLVIPPLRDDGFSPRVLAALPTPARRSAAQRRLFCLVGALLGTVIALVQTIGAGSRTTNLAAFEIKSGDGLTPIRPSAWLSRSRLFPYGLSSGPSCEFRHGCLGHRL